MNYKRKARKLIARIECLFNEKAQILRSDFIHKRSSVSSRRRLSQVTRMLKKLDPDKIIFWGLCIPGDLMSLPDKALEEKIRERRSQLVKNVVELLRANRLKPLP